MNTNNSGIVKQSGNDVEGYRSQKVLFQPNERIFLQYSVSLQFLLTCCVNFRVTSNAVTINEKTFALFVLILYFQFENSVKASPSQKPNQASKALRCLLFLFDTNSKFQVV